MASSRGPDGGGSRRRDGDGDGADGGLDYDAFGALSLDEGAGAGAGAGAMLKLVGVGPSELQQGFRSATLPPAAGVAVDAGVAVTTPAHVAPAAAAPHVAVAGFGKVKQESAMEVAWGLMTPPRSLVKRDLSDLSLVAAAGSPTLASFAEQARARLAKGVAYGLRTTVYQKDRVLVPSVPTMPFDLLRKKAGKLKARLKREHSIERVFFHRRPFVGVEFFCTGRPKQEEAAKLVEEAVACASMLRYKLAEGVARNTYDDVSRRRDVIAAGICFEIAPLVDDAERRYQILIKGAWWDLDKAQARVRVERQTIQEIMQKKLEELRKEDAAAAASPSGTGDAADESGKEREEQDYSAKAEPDTTDVVKQEGEEVNEDADTDPEVAGPPTLSKLFEQLRLKYPTLEAFIGYDDDSDDSADDDNDDNDHNVEVVEGAEGSDSVPLPPQVSPSSPGADADGLERLLRRLELHLSIHVLPSRMASEFILWQIWLEARMACCPLTEFCQHARSKMQCKGQVMLESMLMLDSDAQRLSQCLLDCITFQAPISREIQAGGPKKARTLGDTAAQASSTNGSGGAAPNVTPTAAPAEVPSSPEHDNALTFERLVRAALAARSAEAGLDAATFIPTLNTTVAELVAALVGAFGRVDTMVQMCQKDDNFDETLRSIDTKWRPWLMDVGAFLKAELEKLTPFAHTVDIAHSLLFEDSSVAQQGSELLNELKGFINEMVKEESAFNGTSPREFLCEELRRGVSHFVSDEAVVNRVISDDSAYRLLLPDAEGDAARGNAMRVLEALPEHVSNFSYALVRFREGLEKAANGVINSIRLGTTPSGKVPGKSPSGPMADVNFFQAALALRLAIVDRELSVLSDQTARRGLIRRREDAAAAEAEAHKMDLQLREFSFRWMRRYVVVDADGDCGFAAVAKQVRGASVAEVRDMAAAYLSRPNSLQSYFKFMRGATSDAAERRRQLQAAASEGGLFSDGHAKALAVSLKRRVIILEGPGFGSRMARVYTPEESQRSMRRALSREDLNVVPDDIVLVCDRRSSGVEHCDAMVPAENIIQILRDLPVVDKGFEKWEIRAKAEGAQSDKSASFKLTGYYKGMKYGFAVLAWLLNYRFRRGQAEQDRWEKVFGFKWSADVMTRINDEVRKLPGSEAWRCDCKANGCYNGTKQALHRASIMKRSTEANRQAKLKGDKDAGRQARSDCALMLHFIFDEVVHGGAKGHAASLMRRAAVRRLNASQYSEQKMQQNIFLRLACYMELQKLPSTDPAAAA
eukprot:CAMPEP_0118869262 /NCGR_PEP_ID=MMETSP1163-20130328/12666_1 /TAXON_ID=124430 /ORGANISM="Phaeomonas parva, Strain CCMP2877" /LENGTH=1266 /DNA_ID=CAMNT_0006804141 /DNA_START=213 /DNA_END=4010 /DNA_ORIENTATION=+